jgi:hypothetical protein
VEILASLPAKRKIAAVTSRTPSAKYIDPLDHIWITAAHELGLTVARSPHGYAHTDGKGNLFLAPQEDLDHDDCLAQMILHELCHALVQGEDSFAKPDWGLSNDDRDDVYPDDVTREWACLRVQASLLRPYGLRQLLAPTTDFRVFYDALPPRPLDGAQGREAKLSQDGLSLAHHPPYRRVLTDALAATAELHRAVAKASQRSQRGPASSTTPLPLLWHSSPAPKLHKSGLPMSDGVHEAPASATCAGCAFLLAPEKRTATYRCQRTATEESTGKVVQPGSAACALYEPPLDCQTCAACCRHAFSLVPVRPSDEINWKHPQLVAKSGKDLTVIRDPERRCCAALGDRDDHSFGCRIYHDRPRTCRDFTSGTRNCLEARRRVGLDA